MFITIGVVLATLSQATGTTLVAGSGIFTGHSFAPLVPSLYDESGTPSKDKYLLRDFTQGMSDLPTLAEAGFEHDVGRYNERRLFMYETDLFGSDDPWAAASETRDIHVGVDIGGDAGTPIHSIADGVIHSCGYNPAKGDYGHVIVTEHDLGGECGRVWMLYGHLSKESTAGKKAGDAVQRGAVLGWLGDVHENGGWPPHVHFQLSLVEPETHDLPGVVSNAKHAEALKIYPDPRQVLGPLYDGEFFERDAAA